jgi:SAM-dependent methyltransferase
VIHHAEHPERIIAEARRVLKPNGLFIGMLYGRHSLVALKLWVKHGLLRGRPDRTLADVVAEHMESPGTKAYTVREVRELFSQFTHVTATALLTPYDRMRLPSWVTHLIPDRWGWFICIHAVR